MPLCLTEKLPSTKTDHSKAKWQMFLSNLVPSNAPKINQYNPFFIYNRVIQTSWSDRRKETVGINHIPGTGTAAHSFISHKEVNIVW